MKWFLNLVYLTLLTALSPIIIWRSVCHRRYRRGWREKLVGRLPVVSGDRPVVWFHAVSVGEVLQLQKVVQAFRDQTRDAFQVLITTSTDTGFELAQSRFQDCAVTWFPLDFSWAVSAALDRIRPTLVVLVELELWPNFLSECQRRGISTAIINARMSDRSYRGYRRVRSLIAPILRQITIVAAQNEEYAHRLHDLGVREDALSMTGSIKFDGVLCDRFNDQTAHLRQLFRICDSDTILIAGSTQHPEEQMAVDAWKQLSQSYPELRLIIVPRHRERFDEAAAAVLSSGCELVRRSHLSAGDSVPRTAVILLDTIGELSACWGLADIAFVGGSFGSRGGQNMLEPAAFGAAVMFGPSTSNFRDIVAQLLSASAAIQLDTIDSFMPAVQNLLQQPHHRNQLGHTARSVVLSQQGAIDRTISLLIRALPEPSAQHRVAA